MPIRGLEKYIWENFDVSSSPPEHVYINFDECKEQNVGIECCWPREAIQSISKEGARANTDKTEVKNPNLISEIQNVSNHVNNFIQVDSQNCSVYLDSITYSRVSGDNYEFPFYFEDYEFKAIYKIAGKENGKTASRILRDIRSMLQSMTNTDDFDIQLSFFFTDTDKCELSCPSGTISTTSPKKFLEHMTNAYINTHSDENLNEEEGFKLGNLENFDGLFDSDKVEKCMENIMNDTVDIPNRASFEANCLEPSISKKSRYNFYVHIPFNWN